MATLLHSTRSDDREQHHRHRLCRRRRLLKVRKHIAVELSNFIFFIGNPGKLFMDLVFTEEALEGSKQTCTTSLS